MNVKEQMLAILEENKGKYISGEAIASKLGVTRAAIWKASSSLKDEGFEIETAGRQGYRLSSGSDKLSPAAITRHLKNKVFDIKVLAETDSTNNVAKYEAENGVPEFTVITAEHQTKGKGRMGRSFYSPQGTGIYFTIILRPKIPINDALYITASAAVAVASAIEQICDKKAGIKWVNDIFVDGKKICGILTEASLDMESGNLAYAVLGIGINVAPPNGGFPEELTEIADCLYPNGGYIPGTRGRLLSKVLDNFYDIYSVFPQKIFLDEYRRRSILTGSCVNVHKGNETYKADVIGIDNMCRLIIKKDGKEITLNSGEVSIKI